MVWLILWEICSEICGSEQRLFWTLIIKSFVWIFRSGSFQVFWESCMWLLSTPSPTKKKKIELNLYPETLLFQEFFIVFNLEVKKTEERNFFSSCVRYLVFISEIQFLLLAAARLSWGKVQRKWQTPFQIKLLTAWIKQFLCLNSKKPTHIYILFNFSQTIFWVKGNLTEIDGKTRLPGSCLSKTTPKAYARWIQEQWFDRLKVQDAQTLESTCRRAWDSREPTSPSGVW